MHCTPLLTQVLIPPQGQFSGTKANHMHNFTHYPLTSLKASYLLKAQFISAPALLPGSELADSLTQPKEVQSHSRETSDNVFA